MIDWKYIVSIGEVLIKKGIITEQEIVDKFNRLKKKEWDERYKEN